MVAGAWNMLSSMVVDADMIVALKKLLDRYIDMLEMKGYEI